MRCLFPLLWGLLVGWVVPSPIRDDRGTQGEFDLPEAGVIFCELPPEMDYRGTVQFVEDCDSLEQYEKVPLPGPIEQKLGVHPVVCCPIFRPDSVICFSSDAWCPTYNGTQEDVEESEEITNDDDSYYYEYEYEEADPGPTMADRSCALDENGGPRVISGPGDELNLTLSDCVTLARCPKIFRDEDTVEAAMASMCGFDSDTKQLMVCCPSEYVDVTEDPGAFDQFDLKQSDEDGPAPRFPKNDLPRKCEDKVETALCRKWRNNGGCDLDKDIPIDDKNPLRFRVGSKVMFDFMQGTCMQTCDLCGRKGCVDELFQCESWAREGQCVTRPIFMAHTCRESCGLCGFLSPDSKEEQVVDNLSYTDFTRGNFDCGRSKLLCEINGEECDEDDLEEDKDGEEDIFDLREEDYYNVRGDDDRRKRQTETDDVFFSSDSDQQFSCGATIVSDRWVVAAAHCYDDFGASNNDVRKIRVNTIRDNTASREVVEIKRVYKHPDYTFPNLYNDVAVVELGRRLEYNWDKFGDSPTCLDQRGENVGKVATIQGYGLTETGDRGTLLEAEVNVISNQDCKEILRFNTSENIGARRRIEKALPYGLDFGLLCAQGDVNEDGIFKGSCEGDSGGPLLTDNAGKNTLIGIVSGGVGCGKGYPGWYTKVSFFRDWIQCIIDSSVFFKNNQKDIQGYCRDFATDPPSCELLEDNASIFGDFGGQASAADNCKQYIERIQSNTDV